MLSPATWLVSLIMGFRNRGRGSLSLLVWVLIARNDPCGSPLSSSFELARLLASMIVPKQRAELCFKHLLLGELIRVVTNRMLPKNDIYLVFLLSGHSLLLLLRYLLSLAPVRRPVRADSITVRVTSTWLNSQR